MGLTNCAALEYGKLGIRVNAVCPAAIRTPLLDAAIRQGFASGDALAGMHSLGRMGQTEEVAWAAAFLCQERSAFITGQVFAVDGKTTQ